MPRKWNEVDHCIVIAEVAQAHDGSLGIAHSYIDAAANAGADAIKFQTHIAAAESTPSEAWRVKFSLQDETRYDYWKRMEFTEQQWEGLAKHAREKGLLFLSSPFSLEAVELLTRVGVDAWKIASGEINSPSIIEAIKKTELPVLFSTGMAYIDEIDANMEALQKAKIDTTLLQCTSMYPTPAGKVGLNVMEEYKQRYGCKVGLSDHSGTIYPGLIGAYLGASVLEVHVTFSREMFGVDGPASLTINELKQLCEGIRFAETMRQSPVTKDNMASELAPLRKLFMKSVVARTDLKAGTILTEDDLIMKKPGSGIPAQEIHHVIGKRLRLDRSEDTLLQESDLEDVDV